MSQWLVWFFFYSFLGYGLEKLHARLFRSPRQVRKCFLLLPLCPVYGLAMTALLALAPAKLLQVSAPRPYALCFLLERQDGWLDHFAVMPIPVGHEARVSQLLEAEPRNYVFLLVLEHMERCRELRLTRSHYFVLRQDGRLRFYKGG